MFRRRKIFGLLALAATVALRIHAAAVSSTFTAASGSWNDSANWNPAVVPDNAADTYDVTVTSASVINAMTTDITISSFTSLGSVSFQNSVSGRLLTIEGAVSHAAGNWLVDGSLGLVLNGTTTIGGQIELRNGAGFMNNGVLTVNTATTFADTSLGAPAPRFNLTYNVVNNGTATWNNQNDVQFANFIVANSGNLNVNLSPGKKFIAGTYDQSTATGNTVVSAGASLQANQMNLAAGRVFGMGTYNGSNFVLGNGSNAGATVSPGTAAGTAGALAFEGNFNTIGGATFAFDLGGTSQGVSYDKLAFANNVNFNNTFLEFYLINGFMPDSGDVFTVITGTGSVSGMFANVSGGILTMAGSGSFSVTVGSGVVTLSNFSAVPEPGSVALWLGGMALAAICHRRACR